MLTMVLWYGDVSHRNYKSHRRKQYEQLPKHNTMHTSPLFRQLHILKIPDICALQDYNFFRFNLEKKIDASILFK